MTKNVLVCISGQQFDPSIDEEPNEPIEFITSGTYYEKNNSIYILYNQIDEDNQAVTKNRIKIKGDFIEVNKSGLINSQMIFEKGKRTDSYYDTPFGQMVLGIRTTDIDFHLEEDLLNCIISYELSVNSQALLNSELSLKVISKNQ